MTKTSSTANKNWKDWCVQVFESVAEGSSCACMPLPFDGRTDIHKEDDFYDAVLAKRSQSEDACIDDLYLHKTVVVEKPLEVTQKPIQDRRPSTASTASPFSLLPRQSSMTSDHARFYDSRSFDSLARSTDTGAFSPLQRELPSFGTHKTTKSHHTQNSKQTDHSNGMSSYSQTYTPALSSYLYRHGKSKYGMTGSEKPPPQQNATQRTTSMTSLLSWQSSSVMTTPTSNAKHHPTTNSGLLQVVQHCE